MSRRISIGLAILFSSIGYVRLEAAGLPAVSVQALAVDPTNSQIVYAGTASGVYKTGDGGANWNRVDNGLTYTDVVALAIHPGNPCTIYAGVDSHLLNLVVPPNIFVRNTNGILIRSIDCGATWQVAPEAPSGSAARSIAFTNASPSALYASITVNTVSLNMSLQQHRIARMLPAVTDFSFAFEDFNYVVATDPAGPCTAYIGGLSGTVRTNSSCGPGAMTWSVVGSPLTAGGTPTRVNTIAVHPTNQATLLAGTSAGLIYRKNDNVAPWSPVATVTGSINSIVYEPGNGQVAYAAGSGGTVYKTLDGGSTWSPLATLGTAVSAMAAGRSPALRVHAAGNGFVATVVPLQRLPFTDNLLSSGVTPIKAIHITELRLRIDELRARHGLPAFVWTDSVLVSGASRVRAQHVLDLRVALAAAYTAAARPAPIYTDANLGTGTVARSIHIAELRAAVIALE